MEYVVEIKIILNSFFPWSYVERRNHPQKWKWNLKLFFLEINLFEHYLELNERKLSYSTYKK